MKKIFTFLVAFLTTVSGAVWGQEYQDLCDGPIRIVYNENSNDTYYITCSGQTNNGIIVEGGWDWDYNEPTIYLKDININVGGSGIIISNYSKVTFILEGTNTIVSNGEDAAIDLGNLEASATDVELIIDEKSTGILNIQTANNDDVAIGNCYGGGGMSPCGSLTVRGGTIKTNGRLGNFLGHAFDFGGNAIIIANEIEGTSYNDLHKGGLLFLNDETPYIGEFHTPEDEPASDYEFTLNSPLPEPYQIDLRENGVKVEIGANQTLNKSQLIDNGGQVKGYKVTYSSSKIDDVTTAELPTTKFVGSNYKVEAWDDKATSSDPSTTYERIDQWMLDENGSSWISAGSAIGALGNYTTLSNIPTKNYQAVWYLKEKSITINLTGAGGFDGSFALWYPDQPEMLFTATEQTPALADAGLKLSDDDRTVSGLEELTNPTEGEHTAVLKLNATAGDNKPSELTTTLKVNVIIEEYTVDKVTATATASEDLTYNGKSRKGDIKVEVKPTNGADPIAARFYSVVFKKQNADGTSYGEEQEDIRDAGTYQVIVKATDIANQVLAKDFEKEAGTVTIAQATLTVNEKTPAEWTIGDKELSKAPTFTLETICSDENGELDEVEIDTYDTNEPTSTPTTPGEYDITYSNFKLKGADAANYTVDGSSTVTGKIKVSKEGTTEDPIDDDEDGIEIGDEGWENGSRMYDGLPHNLKSIKVKYGEGEQTITLGENANITYTYKQDAAAEGEGENVDEVKNAGVYVAHFTFPTENNYGYSGDGEVTLTITQATLTATTTDAMPQIGVGESLEDITISSKDATQYIEFEGLQNGEKAAYTGTLKANEDLDTSTEGELENAYTVDVTLAPEGTFDPNNYTTPSYDDIKVSAVVGKITINPGGDGEEGDDVIGGEDTNGDGNFPSKGDFILISPDGEKCSVYDGQPHELKILQIGDYTLKADEDYKVTSYGTTGNPKNAGTYTATIELVADGKYQLENGETSFDLIIHIVKRWVTVDFGDFPASIDIDTETLDASQYANWQKEDKVANEGLVDGEVPIYEGTLVLTPSEEYPEYFNVYLDRETFKVEDNDPFFVNNYEINIYDEEGEKWIKLEENEDGDATLPEGEDDPLVDTPDEEGGIEIEDGSSTSGGGYYQDWNDLIIYESEGATLKSRYDKMRVKDGGKFTLSLTIDEAYAGAEPVVYYRRGRGGDWTPLKISINGLYHVDNVYTDIYVKVMGDGIWVVGNEDITATDARAYAQPNKIVVITPQPTDVQIISMAGAVVATDKVTGQREFANLTEGVYIVRMGETVVKLQVRK